MEVESPSSSVHSLSEDLFQSGGPSLYKVKVNDMMKQEQKRHYPPLKLECYSIPAKKCKALCLKIRCRISKQFCYKELCAKLRNCCHKSQHELPPIHDVKYTYTMKKLVEFFLGEYVIHHEVGLPLRMEIDDADYSGDEYYDKYYGLP